MGSLLVLLTFLGSLNPMYQEPSDQTRRALMETDLVKNEMVQLQTIGEQNLYKYIGFKKEDLVYAVYLYPIVTGKITTKPMQNLKYVTSDGSTIRPEFEYSFRDQTEYTYKLVFLKEF